MNTVNRPEVGEINGLENAQDYHNNVTYKITKQVPWNTKGLKVTRLRLLSDIGFPYWDVSYCHGILDGEPVDVILPFDALPKKGMNAEIVRYAIKDNVFAKGLGILDPWAVSKLC